MSSTESAVVATASSSETGQDLVFKVGDVVTATNREDRVYECQGEVVAVEEPGFHKEGHILVKFGKQFANQSGVLPWEEDQEAKFYFPPDGLRIDDGWSVSTLAERLFPRFYHSVYQLKDRAIQGPCRCKGCSAPCTKRVVINYVGSVVEYLMCDSCAVNWHGKCTESDPYKL
jgi:hypothetical protein